MPVEKLISNLEETLSYLRQSEDSDWARFSVAEIIRKLEIEVELIKTYQVVNIKMLRELYAPTASLQDITIDNGWGEKFLEISEVIDQYT